VGVSYSEICIRIINLVFIKTGISCNKI